MSVSHVGPRCAYGFTQLQLSRTLSPTRLPFIYIPACVYSLLFSPPPRPTRLPFIIHTYRPAIPAISRLLFLFAPPRPTRHGQESAQCACRYSLTIHALMIPRAHASALETRLSSSSSSSSTRTSSLSPVCHKCVHVVHVHVHVHVCAKPTLAPRGLTAIALIPMAKVDVKAAWAPPVPIFALLRAPIYATDRDAATAGGRSLGWRPRGVPRGRLRRRAPWRPVPLRRAGPASATAATRTATAHPKAAATKTARGAAFGGASPASAARKRRLRRRRVERSDGGHEGEVLCGGGEAASVRRLTRSVRRLAGVALLLARRRRGRARRRRATRDLRPGTAGTPAAVRALVVMLARRIRTAPRSSRLELGQEGQIVLAQLRRCRRAPTTRRSECAAGEAARLGEGA